MISSYAKPLARLIGKLEAFPGVGSKSAQRIAFYILNLPENEARELAEAIISAKTEIKQCSVCHNYSEEELCEICSDQKRNREIMCVVADPKDLITIEKTREYNGLYHVLGGVINPTENVTPDDLNIRSLVDRVAKGSFREVIMALNPTIEGDTTALYIARLIKDFGVTVSRIGRGISVGGERDFSDQATMVDALLWRREL